MCWHMPFEAIRVGARRCRTGCPSRRRDGHSGRPCRRSCPGLSAHRRSFAGDRTGGGDAGLVHRRRSRIRCHSWCCGLRRSVRVGTGGPGIPGLAVNGGGPNEAQRAPATQHVPVIISVVTGKRLETIFLGRRTPCAAGPPSTGVRAARRSRYRVITGTAGTGRWWACPRGPSCPPGTRSPHPSATSWPTSPTPGAARTPSAATAATWPPSPPTTGIGKRCWAN